MERRVGVWRAVRRDGGVSLRVSTRSLAGVQTETRQAAEAGGPARVTQAVFISAAADVARQDAEMENEEEELKKKRNSSSSRKKKMED